MKRKDKKQEAVAKFLCFQGFQFDPLPTINICVCQTAALGVLVRVKLADLPSQPRIPADLCCDDVDGPVVSKVFLDRFVIIRKNLGTFETRKAWGSERDRLCGGSKAECSEQGQAGRQAAHYYRGLMAASCSCTDTEVDDIQLKTSTS